MARFLVKDVERVRDTTTTTGTGSLTVSGTAPTGFRTFSAVCSVGDSFDYVISSPSSSEWEVGVGTYTSANTIGRSVRASSNSNALVSLSAGTKDVYLSPSASRVYADNLGREYAWPIN